MIDPRLNDRGFTEEHRAELARMANLIPADHEQLWKDSALELSALRAELRTAERALIGMTMRQSAEQGSYIATLHRSIRRAERS